MARLDATTASGGGPLTTKVLDKLALLRAEEVRKQLVARQAFLASKGDVDDGVDGESRL